MFTFFNVEVGMQGQGLVVNILVGLVAGWLAGMLVRGGGYGLIGDIAVGLLGSFVGSLLFQASGLSIGTGIGPAIGEATIGAVRP